MRTLLCSVAAALVASASLATVAHADGRYVILYKNGSLPSSVAADVAAAGGTVVRTLPEVGVAVATSSSEGFLAAISADNKVQIAGNATASTLPTVSGSGEEPDAGPTPADTLYNAGRQWSINRVHAPDAWAANQTGSHNTVVAVLDTGVAYNHPDLAPNVVYNTCFASVPGCDPYPHYHWHGTHVSGIVAAAFGGGRVVGVAPTTGIANYNIFEPITGCGVCTYEDVRWAAMIDAANRGFKVINMSLGGVGQYGGQGSNDLSAFLQIEKAVAKYVDQQGTVIVASAGNESLNVNGTIVHVPGDIPEIVNVSATAIRPLPVYPAAGSFDISAFYSNYGAAVNVAAPGGDCGDANCTVAGPGYPDTLVLSSGVGPGINLPANHPCTFAHNCPPLYIFAAGTSMSAPHVSATAALIMDTHPGIKPSQVKARLQQDAEDLGDRQKFGHGMVNAGAAGN